MEIRAIAEADTGRVFLKEHAKFRNPPEGKMPLNKTEIIGVLANGSIIEGPSPDIQVAEAWKFTMEKRPEGHRYVVAGVLVPGSKVLVITGFEDLNAKQIRLPRRSGGIGGDGRDTE